jgi:hypothetical protein
MAPTRRTPKNENQSLFDKDDAAAYLRALGAKQACGKFILTLIASKQLPTVGRVGGRRLMVTRQALDNWLQRVERVRR